MQRRKRASRNAPYAPGGTIYSAAFTYDLAGRSKLISRPESDAGGAPTATTEAFYEGLTRRLQDAKGKQTRTIRNAIGDVVRVTNGYGTGDAADAAYTYDGIGRMKTLTAPGPSAAIITHSYNERGLRTQTIDPNLGTWVFDYWPTGELRRLRDAKTAAGNWTTTMAYDRLGRMSQRVDVPEGVTSTWTWDTHTGATCSEGQSGGWGRGRLSTVTQVQSSITQYSENSCYDSLGRLFAKSTFINGEGTFGSTRNLAVRACGSGMNTPMHS